MGDPRAERTRAGLRAALLAECAERPLSEVSVSALVRRAGTGRATFYLHYDDLGRWPSTPAARWSTRRSPPCTRGAVRPIPPRRRPVDRVPRDGRRAGRLYRALLGPGGGGPLGELMHRRLRERARDERELRGAPHSDLIASAVAAAFTGVLADWLHGLVPGTPEELAGGVWRLLISLHGAVPR
ncbi:TetR family transcriptional regulator [Streptomyces sp. M19]